MKLFTLFILILCCFSMAFAEKVAELKELNDPCSLKFHGNEIFILDNPEVKIYSLADYRFLRKFGQTGEGPGEVQPLPDSFFEIHKNKVITNGLCKIAYFSPGGDHLEDKKYSFMALKHLHVGDNLAFLRFNFNQKDTEQSFDVVLHDSQLKKIKSLYSMKQPSVTKLKKIMEPLVMVHIAAAGDRLFVFDQSGGFRIQVFDAAGKKLKSIDVPYEKLPVTEAFKKSVIDFLKQNKSTREIPLLEQNIGFYDTMPVMKSFQVVENKIYVQTYKEKDGRMEFYILDLDGKVLKKVFLPVGLYPRTGGTGDVTFSFKGDYCYYLAEDTAEEVWELHRVKIE